MQFKFHSYKELATGDGFNYPIDVYYGTIFLGTLVALPNAFTIKLIDTPHGKQGIKHTTHNEFKSMDIAAKVLHRTWKVARSGEDEGDNYDKITVPA
jgi:hypothetical protein